MFAKLKKSWVEFWNRTPVEQKKEFKISYFADEECPKPVPRLGHKKHILVGLGYAVKCLNCGKTVKVPEWKAEDFHVPSLDTHIIGIDPYCDHQWQVLNKHFLECSKCLDVKHR